MTPRRNGNSSPSYERYIQDDQEDIRTRMEFLVKKYPQVISDAKAAD
jgi:hypothetical protein